MPFAYYCYEMQIIPIEKNMMIVTKKKVKNNDSFLFNRNTFKVRKSGV
jgi:hypothetical protein